jgi:hypothetical protein
VIADWSPLSTGAVNDDGIQNDVETGLVAASRD